MQSKYGTYVNDRSLSKGEESQPIPLAQLGNTSLRFGDYTCKIKIETFDLQIWKILERYSQHIKVFFANEVKKKFQEKEYQNLFNCLKESISIRHNLRFFREPQLSHGKPDFIISDKNEGLILLEFKCDKIKEINTSLSKTKEQIELYLKDLAPRPYLSFLILHLNNDLTTDQESLKNEIQEIKKLLKDLEENFGGNGNIVPLVIDCFQYRPSDSNIGIINQQILKPIEEFQENTKKNLISNYSA